MLPTAAGLPGAMEQRLLQDGLPQVASLTPGDQARGFPTNPRSRGRGFEARKHTSRQRCSEGSNGAGNKIQQSIKDWFQQSHGVRLRVTLEGHESQCGSGICLALESR